jgi:ribonuclease HII
MKLYIDEAWRWPLAWPLHVWIVLSLKKFVKKDFKDSKKLTEKQREKLFDKINELEHKWSLIYTIWVVGNQEIDNLGITKSINLAIKRGIFELIKKYYNNYLNKSLSRWLCSCDIINKLSIENLLQENFSTENLKNLLKIISQTNPIEKIIIDWNHKFNIEKDLEILVQSVIKWDDKIGEVSMASIVAKVTRDHRMIDIADKQYPKYNFQRHKWYGTKEHIENIQKYWLCKIHRNLFIKNIILN